MASQWYYTKDGVQKGPISSTELKDLAKAKILIPSDMVWKEGMSEWRKAGSIKGIFLSPQSPNVPPPLPTQNISASLNSEKIKGRLNEIKYEFVQNWQKIDSRSHLASCKSCGEEFENTENFCPNCGQKNSINLFKKCFYGFCGFFMMAIIANAGNEKVVRNSDKSSEIKNNTKSDRLNGDSEEPNKALKQRDLEFDYKIGEQFVLGDYKYTIERSQTFRQIGSFMSAKASAGAIYVVVDYIIENCTNESQTVLSDDFKLKDSKGRIYKPSSEANTALIGEDNKDFILSELQPGIPRKMKQAFEVPVNSLDGNLVLLIPKKGLFSSGEVAVIINSR